MRLIDANLCAECEEVFEGSVCPKCGGTNYGQIIKWVEPIHAVKNTQAVGLPLRMRDIDPYAIRCEPR